MEFRSGLAMEEIVKRTLVGPMHIDANTKRRRLVCKVWRKMQTRYPYNNEATLQVTFTSSLEEYTTMKENMTAFLQEDSVKAYLAAQPANVPRYSFNVGKLWSPFGIHHRRGFAKTTTILYQDLSRRCDLTTFC